MSKRNHSAPDVQAEERIIRPSIPRLVDAIRRIGHSLEDMVLDISDNAIPAQASQVSIVFSGQKTFDRIEVADNGHGMDEAVLMEALRLGSDVQYSANSLSKYGVGLKAAALSQGRRLTVLTRKKDKELLKAILDVDLIEERNDYVVVFTKPTDEEAEDFEKKTAGIGTVVVVDKIDVARTESLTMALNKTRRRVAETYHRFMTATDPVSFIINGQRIEPIDPLFIGNSRVEDLLVPTSLEFEDANGKTVVITVRASQLPHPPSQENRKDTKDQFEIKQRNIGFYIYRANRVIKRAETLELFTPDTKLLSFRGSVDFNPDADDFFSLDVAKRRVVISEKVRGKLKEIFTPALNHSRKLWQDAKKAEPQDDEQPNIHKPASSQINAKDPLLSTGRKERTTPEEMAAKASPKITRLPQPPKDKIRIIEMDELADGLLWEPSLDKNGQVYVRVNKSHPFYDKVYRAYASEDPELVEAVDYLLWGLAHAEYNIGYDDEQKVTIMDDLRRFASANLRKLLAE